MKRIFWISALLLVAVTCTVAGQQRPTAAAVPPPTVTPQTYPADQVRAGQARFASQCALCHARDTLGTDTGPDLTRSLLVAQDNRGDKIGPLVKTGRLDKGMPAFDLSDAEISAIVAYVHDQKVKMNAQNGSRRNVEAAQLQTGNADAGRAYFNTNCGTCHSATGDLAGVATRFQGLPLLQRMLYPTGRGVSAPKVTVQVTPQEIVTGTLVSRDEFSIVLTDVNGMRRTFAVDAVKFTVDDKLSAHLDQMGKYTDRDMHNVLAYLQTLQTAR
jgi:cytochrome c oxidase cbb3-type subunit III